jgi:hypothetical protein
MAVYIVTGKLGGGKTLIAVGMIRDALREGRKVATNIDLWLEEMLPWKSQAVICYRLPDKLSAESFDVIGHGNEEFVEVRGRKLYDEKRNGLIVLDEGGLSMNSRDFREQGRKEFIQWCIHSRKKGWDVVIIVQHFDTLDKQIRDMFGEHIVYCLRFDRMAVPIIGGLLKLIGLSGKGAKAHLAVCKYGQSADAPISWRKVFKGADLYFAYDTRQQYFPSDDEAVYQLLSPWHIKGRHKQPRPEWRQALDDIWRAYFHVEVSRLFVFFCALLFGMYAHANWISGDEAPGSAGLPFGGSLLAGDPALESDSDEGGEGASVGRDPWASAWLSRHVLLGGGEALYTFRDADGDKLKVPGGALVRSTGPCDVAVHVAGKRYWVTCRKPQSTGEKKDGDLSPPFSSEVDPSTAG